MSEDNKIKDYRETLLLPRTNLPMKAKLPENEPNFIEFWKKRDIYKKIRKTSKGKDKFILHDGPPYANGNVHLGTALNKILKDIIVRSKQMSGFDAIYRPGWDCHGLPIEWKIEEHYREQGKDKGDIPINEFRSECRLFAKKWIDIQKEEFQRLGVSGDWDNPYTTMEFEAETAIVKEFHKFLMNDDLYCGSKPVMWSVVEKTALAEAEVEYMEHVSPTIWVKFPILEQKNKLKDSNILIWTTTPWTIPANRAIAFSSNYNYGLYEVSETEENSLATKGEKIILNTSLYESVESAAKVSLKFIQEVKNLEKLKKDYKSLGYSTSEVETYLHKLYSIPIYLAIMTSIASILMFNIKYNKSKTFNIIIGILLSVSIYYINYFFNLLGTNEKIPTITSIWLPNLILFLFCIIGLINVNEK